VGAAVSAQAAGDWEGALAEFGKAAGMDGEYAEVRYRQGVVALELGDREGALAHLRAASDGDALAFRTGSDLNRLVRELAEESSGVGLVDVEKFLNEEEPVGREVFLDHVHFDFTGNERVARLLAEEVSSRLPEAMKRGAKPRFARTDAVEARLGLTDWNRVKVWEEMLRRFQQAPFTGQMGHGERDEWMAGRIAELRDTLHPRRYLEAEDIYLEAIGVHPKDPLLQENFAAFLEATDDLQRAVETWQSISSLMPENPLPWFEQGRLLSRLGQLDGAREAFEHSLALRPDLDEARLELGQILFRQNRYEEALSVYEDLRARNPGNPRVLRHMADPLGALERRGEVIECLSKAVELSPSYWEARYLLAVELGFRKDFLGAQQQFALVVAQRPDFVLARDNLGVSYVRTGKLREAREQFVEALRLDPQNAAVRLHLESLDALLKRLSEEQGNPQR
jgi:tetratricopeptide (TPR) repeat protein